MDNPISMQTSWKTYWMVIVLRVPNLLLEKDMDKLFCWMLWKFDLGAFCRMLSTLQFSSHHSSPWNNLWGKKSWRVIGELLICCNNLSSWTSLLGFLITFLWGPLELLFRYCFSAWIIYDFELHFFLDFFQVTRAQLLSSFIGLPFILASFNGPEHGMWNGSIVPNWICLSDAPSVEAKGDHVFGGVYDFIRAGDVVVNAV